MKVLRDNSKGAGSAPGTAPRSSFHVEGHAEGLLRLGRRLLIGVVGGATLLLAAACFGGQEAKLAFVSDRDGNPEIYTMNADGSEQTRHTTNNAVDERPRWSPDRKWIAFVSEESGDREINRLQAGYEEAVPQRLTHSPGADHMHWWSPDGSRIAFVSERLGTPDVYVISADGSTADTTRVTWGGATDTRLDGWSSDGRWLAFVADVDGEPPGIMARNPDGVNLARLTGFQDYDARWSPDNGKIVFTSERDGNQEIYVMEADGSGQRRLTANDSPDYGASWSPDGSKLAFISERDGNPEIYVMEADGSRVSRHTSNQVVDESPVWSPDGKKLAFVSYVYGTAEIFVEDVESREQTRLTHNDANDTAPAW